MSYRLDTPFGEFLVRDRELAESLWRRLRPTLRPGQTIRCSPWRPVDGGETAAAPPPGLAVPARPGERRRWLRHPAAGMLILLETRGGRAGSWVCAACDVNHESVGLDLPPPLEAGVEVLLTFALEEATAFHRLPAVVQRRGPGSGAVRFCWPSAALRERLVGFLGQPPAAS